MKHVRTATALALASAATVVSGMFATAPAQAADTGWGTIVAPTEHTSASGGDTGWGIKGKNVQALKADTGWGL